MKIFVSALEPSANLHLENLLSKLTGVSLVGIFDERFGQPIASSESFSVMGFVDAFKKVIFARRVIREAVVCAKECDKILLIDAPAFNIPLAKALKKAYPKKEIIYYILPKVWAWKKGRIASVERFTDIQAYIFPFEKEFWKSGVYVGNPLMEEIKEFKNSIQVSEITAFLPGSRESEIKRLMPVFRETALRMGGIKILAVPSFIKEDKIASLYGDISDFEVVRDARYALLHSSKAIVCSGTATLEASLIGVATVLVYIAKPLDYAIAKRAVKLKHVGLANIIADFDDKEPMHPELLQEEVSAENILNALESLDQEGFLQKSLWLRERLSQRDKSLTDFF